MTKDHRLTRPDHPPTPGAGTLAVLALAWLVANLSVARQEIGASPETDPMAVTRAALHLPQVISASLIAGVAVGLAAGNLLWRFAPGVADRATARFGVPAAAGALTGTAVASLILLRYGGLPSILVLSGAVATVAGLGGLLAGVRHRVVVAAGAAGTLTVFVVSMLEGVFEGNLRDLFGAGESIQSIATASGWVVLIASLVAGLAAGVVGYLYLRRSGPPELRWPAYLLAGAMPGLLVLLAEAVTRLGGARLFQLVSSASAGDEAVMSFFHATRLNRALIVCFVGAIVAILLLGRTLRPAEHPAEHPVEPPVDQADEPATEPVPDPEPAEQPQAS